MTTQRLFLVSLIASLIFLPGCDIIMGIFKAGFWAAIVLILLIVGLGIYAFKKFQGRR